MRPGKLNKAIIGVHVGRIRIKELLTRHRDLIYLALSFCVILVIFVNDLVFKSLIVGATASIVYILINGNFMGSTFFKERTLRLPLGTLLLICWLGIIGWLFMVFYRLTIIEVTLVLFIASFLSFFMFEFEKIKTVPKKMIQFLRR